MNTPAVTPDQFQYVKLPDGSYGKFSASASDNDIRSAVQKDFPDAFSGAASFPKPFATPNFGNAQQAPQAPPSVWEGFKGLGKGVVREVTQPKEGFSGFSNPVQRWLAYSNPTQAAVGNRVSDAMNAAAIADTVTGVARGLPFIKQSIQNAMRDPEAALPAMQQWWKNRGGVLASERPNGPIHGPGPTPRETPVESQPQAPRPNQGESDLDMEMRLGTANPPEPLRPAPAPNRLGTPEENARIAKAMEGRGAAKQELETGPRPAPQPQAPSSYPPDAPPTFSRPPAETMDRMETRYIQEKIRDMAEMEDAARQRIARTQWFARNAPSTTKGDLVQNAQQATQQAPDLNDPNQLVRLLKSSLKQAQKKPSVQ